MKKSHLKFSSGNFSKYVTSVPIFGLAFSFMVLELSVATPKSFADDDKPMSIAERKRMFEQSNQNSANETSPSRPAPRKLTGDRSAAIGAIFNKGDSGAAESGSGSPKTSDSAPKKLNMKNFSAIGDTLRGGSGSGSESSSPTSGGSSHSPVGKLKQGQGSALSDMLAKRHAGGNNSPKADQGPVIQGHDAPPPPPMGPVHPASKEASGGIPDAPPVAPPLDTAHKSAKSSLKEQIAANKARKGSADKTASGGHADMMAELSKRGSAGLRKTSGGTSPSSHGDEKTSPTSHTKNPMLQGLSSVKLKSTSGSAGHTSPKHTETKQVDFRSVLKKTAK